MSSRSVVMMVRGSLGNDKSVVSCSAKIRLMSVMLSLSILKGLIDRRESKISDTAAGTACLTPFPRRGFHQHGEVAGRPKSDNIETLLGGVSNCDGGRVVRL